MSVIVAAPPRTRTGGSGPRQNPTVSAPATAPTPSAAMRKPKPSAPSPRTWRASSGTYTLKLNTVMLTTKTRPSSSRIIGARAA